MLQYIGPGFLEQGILESTNHVLLAFFEKKETSTEQIEHLQKLDSLFKDRLQIYVGDECYLKWFKEKYKFRGTPFYLFVSEGEVKYRSYGHATEGDLIEIAEKFLPA